MALSSGLIILLLLPFLSADEAGVTSSEVDVSNRTEEYELYEYFEDDETYFHTDYEDGSGEVEDSARLSLTPQARGKKPGRQQKRPQRRKQKRPRGRKPARGRGQQGRGRNTLKINEGCQCGVGGGGGARTRIISGQASEINEFPWMAALMERGQGGRMFAFCGGTLINNLFVITAAHCGIDMSPAAITVRFGEHRLSNKDQTRLQERGVAKIVIHPKYQPGPNIHDIAVLRLKSPVTLDPGVVCPVCLGPARHNFNGERGIVSGWGTLVEGGKTPDELQKVEVTIVSNKACQKAYRTTDIRITPGMMCGGDSNGDHCHGDSGGPLVFTGPKGRYALVGVVSMGWKCGSDRYPGVYTRISFYRNFIRRATRDGVFCRDGNLIGKN